ncbi:trypco2 family protein [Actinoplanes sp. NPDC024001]|uniref:trypco2 family protein n=1 Tax=Actinoplanes sp. NPDC024001 TaxID=3154598 RepID=UPI0033EC08DE
MDGRIGLADAIALLHDELEEARAKGAGREIQFKVGPVELEFQVEVGREGTAGGKVRFYIVEAGAEGKLSSRSMQLVRIHLDPVDAETGTQVAVAEVERGSAPPRPRPSAATG